MNVAASLDELIGETPLLRLDSFAENLLGKVEGQNPYSVKDRIAREIVDAAERDGSLEPGGTVVESTSGNTGIGLASVCAARGYDYVLTMPSSMSAERRAILRALGADLELTPAEEGMSGANERAEEIVSEYDDAIMARQFENEANPAAHRQTTGPELWRATNGDIDALVAGVGTGGTITGVAEYFTEERGETNFTPSRSNPPSLRRSPSSVLTDTTFRGSVPASSPTFFAPNWSTRFGQSRPKRRRRPRANSGGPRACLSGYPRGPHSRRRQRTPTTIRTNWSQSCCLIPASAISRRVCTRPSDRTTAGKRRVKRLSFPH